MLVGKRLSLFHLTYFGPTEMSPDAPKRHVHLMFLVPFHIVVYLGTTITNRNSVHEEIKSRLQSGNICYHSVQNFLSSSLLSKNLKIKIYRTIILPAVLYGCETWSLIFRVGSRLRVFENRVLRRIFGPESDDVTGELEKTT